MRVAASGAQLTVLELRADLAGPREGFSITLYPADLAGCTPVLSTSTVLLNLTLEGVLAACRLARHATKKFALTRSNYPALQALLAFSGA